MVFNYAKELQGNTDKYIMKYVSEIVKNAFQRNLITLDDLYKKSEEEIVDIFKANFFSWKNFNNATALIKTNELPSNFHISFDTKRRNVNPLVRTPHGSKRIVHISGNSRNLHLQLETYQDTKYAHIDTIKVCN